MSVMINFNVNFNQWSISVLSVVYKIVKDVGEILWIAPFSSMIKFILKHYILIRTKKCFEWNNICSRLVIVWDTNMYIYNYKNQFIYTFNLEYIYLDFNVFHQFCSLPVRRTIMVKIKLNILFFYTKFDQYITLNYITQNGNIYVLSHNFSSATLNTSCANCSNKNRLPNHRLSNKFTKQISFI